MNPLTLVKRIQNINSKEAELGISEEASWHAKYKDSAYVFVGGIPFDLTEGDLLAVFAQYGEVVDVNLVRDKGTGKSKGFAFLAYEDQRSTNLAVDNLNGTQISGRVIRVDHVTKYKKKEEEDEETEQRKREERGVCRAFQRGECTRGSSCRFSHNEQRAANTGWGAEDHRLEGSRWGHDKFEGPKKDRKSASNQSIRILETRDKDSWSRTQGNEIRLDSQPKRSDRREEKVGRRHDNDDKFERRERHSRKEEKTSRRYEDDELVLGSREDCDGREEKCSRRHNYDDMESAPRDHLRREDKRSRRLDDVDFELRSGDLDRKEKILRRPDDDEFGSRSREDNTNREGRRSSRQGEDEYAPRSREDYDRKQESNRSHRNDDRREQKRSRR